LCRNHNKNETGEKIDLQKFWRKTEALRVERRWYRGQSKRKASKQAAKLAIQDKNERREAEDKRKRGRWATARDATPRLETSPLMHP